MRTNLVFFFQDESRNSVAALVAGIDYFCKRRDMDIVYARSERELMNSISPDSFNIIAFSVTTVNFHDIYNIFGSVKNKTGKSENVLYVAGGPHADGDPASLLAAGFDLVFSGYSEESFPLFLNRLSESGVSQRSAVIYSETSSVWQKRSFAKFADDYFPPLEIQRGCRYRCNYCQSCVRLGSPLYKSKEAVDEYIDDFHSKGFKRFSFVSPDAFDIRFETDKRSPENISSLFDYLQKRKIKLIEYGQFPSEIRPRGDTGSYFQVLAKYTKNRKIVIGAQSFLDERLRKIRRAHTSADIESTMDAAFRFGFYSIVDIIIGFPDETADERIYTLNRFRELNRKYPSRLHVHYFLPLAGTEMYYSNPSKLDIKTLRLLDKLERDGRAKGWWREGKKMTEKIILMRDRFSGK